MLDLLTAKVYCLTRAGILKCEVINQQIPLLIRGLDDFVRSCKYKKLQQSNAVLQLEILHY